MVEINAGEFGGLVLSEAAEGVKSFVASEIVEYYEQLREEFEAVGETFFSPLDELTDQVIDDITLEVFGSYGHLLDQDGDGLDESDLAGLEENLADINIGARILMAQYAINVYGITLRKKKVKDFFNGFEGFENQDSLELDDINDLAENLVDKNLVSDEDWIYAQALTSAIVSVLSDYRKEGTTYPGYDEVKGALKRFGKAIHKEDVSVLKTEKDLKKSDTVILGLFAIDVLYKIKEQSGGDKDLTEETITGIYEAIAVFEQDEFMSSLKNLIAFDRIEVEKAEIGIDRNVDFIAKGCVVHITSEERNKGTYEKLLSKIPGMVEEARKSEVEAFFQYFFIEKNPQNDSWFLSQYSKIRDIKLTEGGLRGFLNDIPGGDLASRQLGIDSNTDNLGDYFDSFGFTRSVASKIRDEYVGEVQDSATKPSIAKTVDAIFDYDDKNDMKALVEQHLTSAAIVKKPEEGMEWKSNTIDTLVGLTRLIGEFYEGLDEASMDKLAKIGFGIQLWTHKGEIIDIWDSNVRAELKARKGIVDPLEFAGSKILDHWLEMAELSPALTGLGVGNFAVGMRKAGALQGVRQALSYGLFGPTVLERPVGAPLSQALGPAFLIAGVKILVLDVWFDLEIDNETGEWTMRGDTDHVKDIPEDIWESIIGILYLITGSKSTGVAKKGIDKLRGIKKGGGDKPYQSRGIGNRNVDIDNIGRIVKEEFEKNPTKRCQKIKGVSVTELNESLTGFTNRLTVIEDIKINGQDGTHVRNHFINTRNGDYMEVSYYLDEKGKVIARVPAYGSDTIKRHKKGAAGTRQMLREFGEFQSEVDEPKAKRKLELPNRKDGLEVKIEDRGVTEESAKRGARPTRKYTVTRQNTAGTNYTVEVTINGFGEATPPPAYDIRVYGSDGMEMANKLEVKTKPSILGDFLEKTRDGFSTDLAFDSLENEQRIGAGQPATASNQAQLDLHTRLDQFNGYAVNNGEIPSDTTISFKPGTRSAGGGGTGGGTTVELDDPTRPRVAVQEDGRPSSLKELLRRMHIDEKGQCDPVELVRGMIEFFVERPATAMYGPETPVGQFLNKLSTDPAFRSQFFSDMQVRVTEGLKPKMNAVEGIGAVMMVVFAIAMGVQRQSVLNAEEAGKVAAPAMVGFGAGMVTGGVAEGVIGSLRFVKAAPGLWGKAIAVAGGFVVGMTAGMWAHHALGIPLERRHPMFAHYVGASGEILFSGGGVTDLLVMGVTNNTDDIYVWMNESVPGIEFNFKDPSRRWVDINNMRLHPQIHRDWTLAWNNEIDSAVKNREDRIEMVRSQLEAWKKEPFFKSPEGGKRYEEEIAKYEKEIEELKAKKITDENAWRDSQLVELIDAKDQLDQGRAMAKAHLRMATIPSRAISYIHKLGEQYLPSDLYDSIVKLEGKILDPNLEEVELGTGMSVKGILGEKLYQYRVMAMSILIPYINAVEFYKGGFGGAELHGIEKEEVSRFDADELVAAEAVFLEQPADEPYFSREKGLEGSIMETPGAKELERVAKITTKDGRPALSRSVAEYIMMQDSLASRVTTLEAYELLHPNWQEKAEELRREKRIEELPEELQLLIALLEELDGEIAGSETPLEQDL